MGTQNTGPRQIWNIEVERERLNKEVDLSRTSKSRNILGQFETPQWLAKEICSNSVALIKGKKTIKCLEPSVGSGSFVSAFFSLGINNINITGVDIDSEYLSIAQKCFGDKTELINDDFLYWNDERKFDLIITNPPYVRHHHIKAETKLDKSREYSELMNDKFSQLSGLYCYFIIEAMKHLAYEGISVWLIPSEILDVNYGQSIKQYLINNFSIPRIHIFANEESKFDDALVSSCVLFIKNKKHASNEKVSFTYGDSLNCPAKELSFTYDRLAIIEKWGHLEKGEPIDQKDSNEIRLGSILSVSRGIATGDNDFFVLPEDKVKELAIPMSELTPIIPPARKVKVSVIKSDKNGNPTNVEKLFLIDTRLSESEIEIKYPELYAYIQSGKDTVANHFLCKNRKVWYFQERRKPPLFLCTYMGREKKAGQSAFRFIKNDSKAIALNSFLMLYPTEKCIEMFSNGSLTPERLFEILNNITDCVLFKAGRSYGGGLKKLEPKELLAVKVSLSSK